MHKLVFNDASGDRLTLSMGELGVVTAHALRKVAHLIDQGFIVHPNSDSSWQITRPVHSCPYLDFFDWEEDTVEYIGLLKVSPAPKRPA